MSLFHSIKYNITDASDYRQLRQLPPEIISKWEDECITLLQISPATLESSKIIGLNPVISRLTTKELLKIVSPETNDGIDYTKICTNILKRIIYEYEG